MAGAYNRIKTKDIYCRSCGKSTPIKRVKPETYAEVTNELPSGIGGGNAETLQNC